MNNDQIVKISCNFFNIDLIKFQPFHDEKGTYTDEYFDKRFALDRTYAYNFNNYKKRIRFVIYPTDNYVSVFINTILISNINVNIYNERCALYKGKKEILSLKEIEKRFKLLERYPKINRIMNR